MSVVAAIGVLVVLWVVAEALTPKRRVPYRRGIAPAAPIDPARDPGACDRARIVQWSEQQHSASWEPSPTAHAMHRAEFHALHQAFPRLTPEQLAAIAQRRADERKVKP